MLFIKGTIITIDHTIEEWYEKNLPDWEYIRVNDKRVIIRQREKSSHNDTSSTSHLENKGEYI